MEREIKFRGKRIDNGEWVYGNLHVDSQGNYHICDTKALHTQLPGDMWKTVQSETVGQLTANPFVNGVRVEEYEGDIVQFDTEDGMVTALVEYQINDAEDMWISGFAYRKLWVDTEVEESEDFDGFRIAGNVWDNPELLTQPQN